MQNFITFLHTELSREKKSQLSNETIIVSTEHWRIISNGKVTNLKIVCNFIQAPFFMVEDSYLPDSLLTEFELLCQEPLLHKSPEKLEAFVQKISQYQG
ncbi:MAG: hypothetical protein CML21_00530 [Rheinheimera sp.]|nr:hypothetical protein [Rheinheimera sp.]|tara:strand:- start:376 stop:672 length:297 start_codon:yes stop_codon:yes gene_type:complete